MAAVFADFFVAVAAERLQRHSIIVNAAKSKKATDAITMPTIADVVKADVSGRYDFPTAK